MSSTEFPQKPIDRCTLGSNIALTANHFSIQMPNAIDVIQYDVALLKDEKSVESKELGRKLLGRFIQLRPKIAGRVFYDFKKLLFSFDELIEDEKEEVNEFLACFTFVFKVEILFHSFLFHLKLEVGFSRWSSRKHDV